MKVFLNFQRIQGENPDRKCCADIHARTVRIERELYLTLIMGI